MNVRQRIARSWLWPIAGLLSAGWSGYEFEDKGIRFVIDEIAPVVDPASPTPVTVTVSNAGPEAARGTVQVKDLVDDWKAAGPAAAAIDLAPGAATALTFRIASGPFVFDALYPVHVYFARERGGDPLHAVRIFEVRRTQPPVSVAARETTLRLESDAALPLRAERARRFGWERDGGGTGGRACRVERRLPVLKHGPNTACGGKCP